MDGESEGVFNLVFRALNISQSSKDLHSSSHPAIQATARHQLLVRDADDTASGTGAGVTGLEGLGVTTLAEIVGASVDNDGTLVLLAAIPSSLAGTMALGVLGKTRRQDELTPITLWGPISLMKES